MILENKYCTSTRAQYEYYDNLSHARSQAASCLYSCIQVVSASCLSARTWGFLEPQTKSALSCPAFLLGIMFPAGFLEFTRVEAFSPAVEKSLSGIIPSF